MKSELKIFENEKFGKVRSTMIGEEPWFIATDVCRALSIANSRDAVNRLEADEKADVGLTDGSQKRHMTAVNEAGLYSLILSSRKPEAKDFRRWITHDVLPTIRKTGGYVNNEDQFVNTYLSHLDPHSKQLFHLTLEALKDANRQIKELKPNAEYCCKVLTAPGTLTMTQIATEYGKSAQEMNRILHELRVQRKVNNQWVLYRKYSDKGYTKDHTYTKERGGVINTYVNTQWTQKGRRFLYDLLKKHGMIPVSEQVA